MRYSLGVDLGGLSLAVAVDRGAGAADTPTGRSGRSRLPELVEAVGRPTAGAPTDDDPSGVLGSLVAAAVAQAETAEGAPADVVAVACPSTWGPYRLGLLRAALDAADLARARLVPDALALAAHAGPEAPAEGLLAVLHVRDEAVTVAVVRRSAAAPPSLEGTARAVTHLGGADVPDAVLAHVRDVVAPVPSGRERPRPEDPAVTPAAVELRARAVRAGHALLLGEPVTVHADPWAPAREVRMVPSELDARLRPRVARAVAAAAAAVATRAPDGVDAVLLAGRLATLPLLEEEVAARFDAPLVVVPDGDAAVARGAAELGPSLPAPVEVAPGAAGAPGAHRHRAAPRRRPSRPLRVAALAGTGAVLLGALAVAVSADAFADPGPRDATAVVARLGVG